MAVITFCSNETKETGQTLSLAAVATYMAIEHNYKILMIPTSFNDLSLENCFWEYSKIRPTGALAGGGPQNVGLTSGIEGLAQVLNSNRTNDDIVKSYSRIILKDRLDILLSPATTSFEDYMKLTPYYAKILPIADKAYDLVFVDLSKKMPQNDKNEILQASDIVMMNLTQRLKTITDFMALRETNEFYRKNNIMLALGRYDKFSKYNNKNVTRYMKEKRMLSVVPYNTLYFEACSEGTAIDYLLKVRNITDETDRNINFVNELKAISNNILYKLQELQMKI